jgi:protein-S-isoprenylcysteine O-methyltransferase Ste14
LALNLGHAFQVAGVVVGFLGVGRMAGANAPLQLSGVGFMVAGIAVRWTAMHALGRLFTGRVTIREGHTLVQTGLYSRLRHPAYAGSLLAYVGLGLAFANWCTLACSVLPYLVALGYRIRVEEEVLHATFGHAYAQYARTTKRIVPWVY